jgi:hypothetical protein
MAGSWYDDGVTPGVERWFDGTEWSEHTRPVWVAPVPIAPSPPAGSPQWPVQQWPAPQAPAQQWPAQQGSMAASGPTDAVHWMLPVGRSWQSITAGYVGLLALGIWVLGPVAIWLGIWAMQKARAGGHGRGRAIFAIVTGTLGTLFMALFLVSRAHT